VFGPLLHPTKGGKRSRKKGGKLEKKEENQVMKPTTTPVGITLKKKWIREK